jgi:tetratricopeptide (TPR) repeat protein
MNIYNFKPINAFFISIILVCMTSVVMASGGGGGGGVSGLPSSNLPSFDPAEKFDEGMKYLQAKEYKKASRSFKKVLSVVKKHAPANYFLGLSYIGLEKYKKAIKPLEKAIKYEPKLIAARGYLGMSYLKMKKNEKANKQRDELKNIQSQCGECDNKQKIIDALTQIDSHDKVGYLENIRPESSHSKGDLLYLEAVANINRGEYSTALNKLQRASLVFGPHPEILTYQGFANRKLGNLKQSLYYYQMALIVAPEHKGANEYLGEYYVVIGDMHRANNQLAKLDEICDFSCEEAQELKRWILEAGQ